MQGIYRGWVGLGLYYLQDIVDECCIERSSELL